MKIRLCETANLSAIQILSLSLITVNVILLSIMKVCFDVKRDMGLENRVILKPQILRAVRLIVNLATLK